MSNNKKAKHEITLIREGDIAIACENGHLKASTWKLTGPTGRKFKTLHLYPWANWQLLELAARRWLQGRGIQLQEGEVAVCPPGLTLSEMLG